jgi:hypothetical protein
MKGDFSRDSFDQLRHYSRVLQQQGRVELDADGNERQAIQLHLVRSLAADIIGPQGGPGTAFQVMATAADGGMPLANDLRIRTGHYYVDGWLCENESDVFFAGSAEHQPGQPSWTPPADALQRTGNYLAYLDVWERHIAAPEVDPAVASNSPATLREVGLGGPDTTTRAQVVWQVKVILDGGPLKLPELPIDEKKWESWMLSGWVALRNSLQSPARASLKVQVSVPAEAATPCVVSPESRYRGLENQLYRIEIHQGGDTKSNPPATFVWSRENGSVVFPVERIDSSSVTLVEGWRDERLGLAVGDIVELSDEKIALSGSAGPLRRVTAVDLDTLTIAFSPNLDDTDVAADRHAILRRWDHGRRNAGGDGQPGSGGRPALAADLGLVISEGAWLTIEDGIQVWFTGSTPAPGLPAQAYRSGDHWLVAARTALGDVLWPHEEDNPNKPKALAPHGVTHHFAPLAVVTVKANGVTVDDTPRRTFVSLVELSKLAS